MHLEILTPESKVFDGEVSMVKLPGSKEQGSFTILEGHAPIISALQPGKVKIRTEAQQERDFIVKSGFVEASDDKVSVVVEGLEEEAEDA